MYNYEVVLASGKKKEAKRQNAGAFDFTSVSPSSDFLWSRARAKAHWENQPSLPLSPPLPLPPPPNSHENQSVLVLSYVARSIHSLFPKIKTRNIPLNNFFDINRIKSSYHRDDIFKKTSFIQNKYIYIYSYCILLRDTKVTIFNWYRVIEEKIHG